MRYPAIWEMATPEQAEERKREYNVAKATHTKAYTHSRKDRHNLAKAIMLSPDEAEAWGNEMKKEANKNAIPLRRIRHHLLGDVVREKDMGGAQAVPEEGTLMEQLNDEEIETGRLRESLSEAIDEL
jgi:hypothetical protein